MSHAAIATMWWFLVMPAHPSTTIWSGQIRGNDFSHTQTYPEECQRDCGTDIPQAIGPFPSEQMCLRAERMVEPNNQYFWTPEEKTKWQQQVEAYNNSV